jgi:hypothetical protein
MRYVRTICALGAVVALAVPVAASAHPSVYSDEAVRDANPDEGPYEEEVHIRHVVVNHGYTWVFRETNGLDDEATDGGVITYSRLPGDYRASIPPSQAIAEGNTAAQPHATCDVPVLTTEQAITGWQEGDPFYNYVPFQKADAGLDDNPSDWIDDVRSLTGVDLSTVSDDPDVALGQLEQRCTSIGGTFYEPDTVQNTRESMASGLVEPLEEEIARLEAELAAAQQARTAAEQALAAARAGVNNAAAQTLPALRPLRVTMPTARVKARRIAQRGMTVTVTGPALKPVFVKLRIGKSRAKALGLRQRVLGTATAPIGSDGTAAITIKPTKSAARALRRMKQSLAIQVVAAANEWTSARGTLTR